MVIDSTNDAMADDPAQSATTKPTETTSAWPRCRIESTVGSISVSVTSGVKIVRSRVTTCSCTEAIVSGPNQLLTKPIEPSNASSSGAVDRVNQNAASAAIPNSESSQALDAVRLSTLAQRCVVPGGTTIGAVPGRCHGTTSASAGE